MEVCSLGHKVLAASYSERSSPSALGEQQNVFSNALQSSKHNTLLKENIFWTFEKIRLLMHVQPISKVMSAYIGILSVAYMPNDIPF